MEKPHSRILRLTCFGEFNLLSVSMKLFGGRGIMRVDLNRDFHEKINYFSVFHQCKIVSGRISSCLNEAGVNAAQNKNPVCPQ